MDKLTTSFGVGFDQRNVVLVASQRDLLGHDGLTIRDEFARATITINPATVSFVALLGHLFAVVPAAGTEWVSGLGVDESGHCEIMTESCEVVRE